MGISTSSQITPYLWFDGQARSAADLYCRLFPASGILSDSGKIVEFELNGLKFVGLNGGPRYRFTEAVSFMITCADQEEVDHYWYGLTADGGAEGPCGWCKDPFGLSWQVVPQRFLDMMKSGSPRQIEQIMQAMMPMKRMIVQEFEEAFRR